MNSQVILVMKPCWKVNSYQCFRRVCCIHLHNSQKQIESWLLCFQVVKICLICSPTVNYFTFVTIVFITFVVSNKHYLIFIACFWLPYVSVCYSRCIKTMHNDKYCVKFMFLNCSLLCVHNVSLLMICKFQTVC